MWATRLMPVAKKCGSSSAPWMVAANSSAEAPADGRDVDPDLLEHLALHQPAHAAAAGRAVGVLAVPGRVVEARRRCPASRSIASNSAQIRSRSDSNQSRAACCWSSSSIITASACADAAARPDLQAALRAGRPALKLFGLGIVCSRATPGCHSDRGPLHPLYADGRLVRDPGGCRARRPGRCHGRAGDIAGRLDRRNRGLSASGVAAATGGVDDVLPHRRPVGAGDELLCIANFRGAHTRRAGV